MKSWDTDRDLGDFCSKSQIFKAKAANKDEKGARKEA